MQVWKLDLGSVHWHLRKHVYRDRHRMSQVSIVAGPFLREFNFVHAGNYLGQLSHFLFVEKSLWYRLSHRRVWIMQRCYMMLAGVGYFSYISDIKE